MPTHGLEQLFGCLYNALWQQYAAQERRQGGVNGDDSSRNSHSQADGGETLQPTRQAGDMSELRRKLRKLHPTTSRRQSAPIRRDIPERPRQPEPEPAWQPPPGEPVSLEDAVDGVEISAPVGGPAYLVRSPLAELDAQYHELSGDFQAALAREESDLRLLLLGAGAADDLQPQDLIFLDLETTGLTSTPLFLIGTMAWEGKSFVINQYLARNYAEEAAVISLLAAEAADKLLLVSFNGKAYDLPYVQMRAAATGVRFEVEFAHCDLLHEARRAWADRLPDCKLQTLEAHICGRPRHNDIPGSEIPEAYHEFVRTGNAAQMIAILQHNVLDLITLAEIMLKLPPR